MKMQLLEYCECADLQLLECREYAARYFPVAVILSVATLVNFLELLCIELNRAILRMMWRHEENFHIAYHGS